MSNDIKIKYPKCLKSLADIFKRNGYPFYIVGGFVRDSLLGYECNDIDICSNAKPQKAIEMLSANEKFKVADSNLPLGTLLIKHDAMVFEYTAFRSESYKRDGTHTPNAVSLNATIEQDAARRDFTANALYYDIQNENLIDFFGGLDDIKNKVLSTTRNAYNVFTEDALRMLRMCRLCAENMFIPSMEIICAAKKLKYLINNLSIERIIQEMHRLLISDMRYPCNYKNNLAHGIKLLFNSGIADVLLQGVRYENAYLAKNAKNTAVKIALLVFNADKPEKSLNFLCANNDIKKDVLFLINNIDFNDDESLELLADFGYQKGYKLNEFISILDIKVPKLQKYLDNMKQNNEILSINTLAVSGQDIMEALNIKSSPQVGRIKMELLMHVIEFPEKNTKKCLISYIKKSTKKPAVKF